MSLVILDVGDASLSYFVAGKGRPVTLLHGFTQSGRSWRELIAKMPEGWEWIVPDLRGHGETQIWKITHNGVDTHAIHFHLFNVQLLNRVGWDGAIRPADRL